MLSTSPLLLCDCIQGQGVCKGTYLKTLIWEEEEENFNFKSVLKNTFCHNDEMSLGIKEILRRIWVILADKIKTSESVCKQSSQPKLNSSLWQIIAALKA